MDAMTCEKISPCPFCGNNETHLHKTVSTVGDKIADCYQVHCHSCHANGPLRPDRVEAINYWNQISDRWFSVTAPVAGNRSGVLDALDRYARGKENKLFECLGCGLLENHQGVCWRCGGNEWQERGTAKSPEACMVDTIDHYARSHDPERFGIYILPEASGGPRGNSKADIDQVIERWKKQKREELTRPLFECFGCGLLHTSQEAACPRCGGTEWKPFDLSKAKEEALINGSK